MKSFFKKLAFVMAMAMVVSLAAPAAAQAATPLYAAEQESKKPVTEWETTVIGDEKDLCFIGAPKGWRDLKHGWESSNPDVVTVDDNGLMVTTGYGAATVTFEMEGCETVSVVVVVKKATEFEPTQLTEKKMAFVYPAAVNYTAADVKLYRVFVLMSGEKYPIEVSDIKVELSTDKTSVYVTAPENFTDGELFKVVIGGEGKEFTTKIGNIDEVQITVDPSSAKIYANEEGSSEHFATFGFKLLSNGVELTKLYEDRMEPMTYKLVSPTDEDENAPYVEFEDSGVIRFTKPDVEALVSAVYTYYDAEGNTKTIESAPIKVKSEQAPEWKFEGITDWCFINVEDNDNKTLPGKADWSVKKIAADVSNAGEYQIMLKMVDSLGNEYATHAAGVKDKIKSLDTITAAGYSFEILSANTDFMLLDATTGRIAVYKEGVGSFYVKQFKLDSEGNRKLDGYAYANSVKIDAPRRLDKIEISTDSLVLNAAALLGYDHLTTGEVTIASKDQYNKDWYKADENVYTVTSSNAALNKLISDENIGLSGVYGIKLDGHKIELDAEELYKNSAKATSITFTVTEKASQKSDTFKVSIKKPNYNQDGSIKVDEVVSGTYGTYNKVTVGVDNIDIAVDNGNVTDQFANITLYKTSNTVEVGQYEAAGGADVEDNIILVKDVNWEVPKTATAGTRFVVVTNAKGVIQTNIEWTNTDDKGDFLQLQLAGNNGGKMWYAEKGTYTVKVITVRYASGTTQYNSTVTKTFSVSNSTAYKVDFVGRVDDYSDASTIEEIVVENLKFNLNGSEWKKINTDMIAHVDTVTYGGFVIIKSVKIHVPTDGETAKKTWNEVVVPVNVSVEAPNL